MKDFGLLKFVGLLCVAAILYVVALTLAGPHIDELRTLAPPYAIGATVISFKTDLCFAGCPVYSFEILASGDQVAVLRFHGQHFTCAEGRRSTSISHQVVDELEAEVEKSDFLTSPHNFGEILNDAQNYLIDVSMDGRRNIVHSYFGSSRTPDAITALAKHLNSLPAIQDWLYGCPESERMRALNR